MSQEFILNGRSFRLLPAGDRQPLSGRLTFDDMESTRHWLQLLLSIPDGSHILRDWLRSTVHTRPTDEMSEHDLMEHMAWQLLSGEAVVATKSAGPKVMTHGIGLEEFTPAPVAAVAAGGPPVDTSRDDPVRDKVHWIEIELLDEDDKPVAHQDYVITHPDGKESRGRLNRQGIARVSSIADPGTCKVTFPNLDMDAWERI